MFIFVVVCTWVWRGHAPVHSDTIPYHAPDEQHTTPSVRISSHLGSSRAARALSAPCRIVALYLQSNNREFTGDAHPLSRINSTQSEVSSMAIRQSIAQQLAVAAQAIANDKSKENAGKAIIIARLKLANWIAPTAPKLIR